MKIYSVLVAFMALLCNGNVSAQMPIFSGDARSQGIAGAQVMLRGHWPGITNPACLAGIEGPVFGLFCRNYYQIPELNQFSGSLGLPTALGCFGLGYATIGYSGVGQNHAVLAYGHKLGKKINAGIGLHYLNLRQTEEFEDCHSVLPSVGILLMPAERFMMALSWFNPADQQYALEESSLIPSAVYVGAGYYFEKTVLLCIEIRKDMHDRLVCSGGFEVNIITPLFIRFGLSSAEHKRFSAGLGLRLKHLSMDLAADRHPVMGYITAISVNYNLKSVLAY